MGRELRMVPADWVHPRDERGRYIPMLDTSYSEAVKQWRDADLPEWIEGHRLWMDERKVKKYDGSLVSIDEMLAEARAEAKEWNPVPVNPTYQWWAGDMPLEPDPADYMPDWPDELRTHFMMYEDTSEGTPISPAFANAEDLARWLADTGASAFASQTASYEQWLATIKRGSAHSATLVDGQIVSGVVDLARQTESSD